MPGERQPHREDHERHVGGDQPDKHREIAVEQPVERRVDQPGGSEQRIDRTGAAEQVRSRRRCG